uniref:Uncharacterized protein n=1 Tax=Accipiter nisus TaxID=211598 RepID=A0A8B9MGH3_9AVES
MACLCGACCPGCRGREHSQKCFGCSVAGQPPAQEFPLLFLGIPLCFPGILPVRFLGLLPPVFWEFSWCFLRNCASRQEFPTGFVHFLFVLCRNLPCVF